jgi:hypothetical protein
MDMKINPYMYGLVVLGVFMGVIQGAQQLGWWSTSGKVDGAGQGVLPSAGDMESIKGWMTLDEVSKTFAVAVPEILSAFNPPADTPASTPLKDLESDTFDIPAFRTWLSEQSAMPWARPGSRL